MGWDGGPDRPDIMDEDESYRWAVDVDALIEMSSAKNLFPRLTDLEAFIVTLNGCCRVTSFIRVPLRVLSVEWEAFSPGLSETESPWTEALLSFARALPTTLKELTFDGYMPVEMVEVLSSHGQTEGLLKNLEVFRCGVKCCTPRFLAVLEALPTLRSLLLGRMESKSFSPLTPDARPLQFQALVDLELGGHYLSVYTLITRLSAGLEALSVDTTGTDANSLIQLFEGIRRFSGTIRRLTCKTGYKWNIDPELTSGFWEGLNPVLSCPHITEFRFSFAGSRLVRVTSARFVQDASRVWQNLQVLSIHHADPMDELATYDLRALESLAANCPSLRQLSLRPFILASHFPAPAQAMLRPTSITLDLGPMKITPPFQFAAYIAVLWPNAVLTPYRHPTFNSNLEEVNDALQVLRWHRAALVSPASVFRPVETSMAQSVEEISRALR